tara:strand:- start:4 stop:213 length:210 start_codon:yes stop_codon:yes gene_type:complete
MDSFEDQKIIDMILCFTQYERPDLIEYLNYMMEAIQQEDEYDASGETDDEYNGEEIEVIEDENGFLSLV